MHFLCTFPFWWCTLKKYQHVITSVMIFCSYPVITNTMFHLLKFIVYIYWCLIVSYWMSLFYVWPTSTFWSVIFFSYVDIQRMDKHDKKELNMSPFEFQRWKTKVLWVWNGMTGRKLWQNYYFGRSNLPFKL